MKRVKNLSVIFVFFALLFSTFLGINLEFKKIKNLNAESSYISINAYKVNYTYLEETQNSDGTTNSVTKKIGECSSDELFSKKSEILKNVMTNNGETITYSSGEVASIKSGTNQAIFINLESKSNAKITSITPSVTLTNSIGTYKILTDVVNINNNIEYLLALDFSNLKDNMGQDVSYEEGLFNLSFNCAYTTDGTNTIIEKIDFSLYLIDENVYFGDNKYSISSSNSTIENEDTYFFNNTSDNGEQAKLVYDPTKFEPEIEFVYNETNISLTTKYEYNEKDEEYKNGKVTLVSSNEKIIPSEIFKVNETADKKTVNLTFKTLGQYKITYYLIFNLNGTYTKIDLDKCQKLTELTAQNLIIFGYEAYYKNYSTDNLDYSYLYNDIYSSNFSYLAKGRTTSTKTSESERIVENIELIKNSVLEKLNLGNDLSNKIAKTNQAPVKINSYVTENLTEAKYFMIEQGTTFSISEKTTSGEAFLSSKRFEENGLYLVIIPYKFSLANKSEIYYSVLLFNIKNDTPSLDFFEDENFSKTISANGFTNKDVYVCWDKDEELPFMAKTSVKIVKDNTVLTNPTINYKKINDKNKNYIKFSENGEYVVQLTYGVYETTIEKKFTIDKTEFYKDKSVDNENNFKIVEIVEYGLNDISKSTNTTTIFGQNVIVTKNNFAIFAKNRNYKANTISIKYDYITLDNVTAQNKFEIVDGKLVVYNNYQFSKLYTNLTYSNSTLNNMTDWSELNSGKLENNSSAQISISALYRFTISDKAGNSSEFYVLLDKTENVVLETSEVVNLDTDNNKLVNDDNEEVDKTKVFEKQNYVNIISSSYSIICGDYKGLEILVENNASTIEQFNKFFNNKEFSIADGIYLIKIENDAITYSREDKVGASATAVNETISKGNIFSVKPTGESENRSEIDYIYTITVNNKTVNFELNTDKNLILICGEDDSGNFRVYSGGATNSGKVYIHFLNDAVSVDDELDSLVLTYYAYDKQNEVYLSGQTFDLLNSTNSGNITLDGNVYSGYVTSVINSTYSNGKYVTKEGKYEITKAFKGDVDKKITQTFYVDRLSPLELLDDSKELFTFNGKSLTKSILNNNFITNNLAIKTNMLNILGVGFDNLSKYPDSANNSIKLNYILLDNSKQVVENFDGNLSKLASSKYYIRIYDNCGKFDQNNNLVISTCNYVDVEINIDQSKPSGKFVINEKQEILQKSSSTNSDTLSFVFEDSTSDYLYNIDYKNLVLYYGDNVEIFRTFSKSSSLYTGIFNLDGGEQVSYYSRIGKVFDLTREELSSVTESGKKRYRYTLTILDPVKSNYSLDGFNLFDENGISIENTFKLVVNYDCGDYELTFGENNFKTEEYSMIIDHTSPKENVIQYLINDKFLSGEYDEKTKTFTGEKLEMYNSILNKDISNEINFENYSFVLTNNSLSPQNFGVTDTSNIYIRKYDKYNKTDDENLQSFVIGDPRFENLLIKRNRFDVNAKLNGKNIYTPKSYSSENSIETFFIESGYYEIIEIDQAGNYTIYSVLYIPSNDFDFSYTLDNETTAKIVKTSDEENSTAEINHSGIKLNLNELNISNFSPLNIEVSINEGTDNEQITKFRYFPVEVGNSEISYFTSTSTLVNNINTVLNSYSGVNEFGNVYKVKLTNSNGKTIILTNSTPNKELSIDSYIISDNEKLVFTIPFVKTSATKIESFNVYPVIDGAVDKTNPLLTDSNSKELTIENQTSDISFVFTSSISISDASSLTGFTQKTVNIYYFEWTDNFGRVQRVVKEINSQDKKMLDFKNNTNIKLDDEIYTSTLDVDFIYQTNLYSIDVQYQLLPNTYLTTLYSNNETKGEAKINFYNLLSEIYGKNQDGTSNLDKVADSQEFRFIIKLTDLKTLMIEDEVTIYEYSFIYYPNMPSVEFTDSSSNSLSIYPTKVTQSSITTSKNVNMFLTNNTLFSVSVNAKRTYTDDFGQEIVEDLTDLGNEYTFNKLGKYVLLIENELGNKQEYVFNITTANNKTYFVRTNETDIANYELESNNLTQTLKFNGGEQVFEIYYSIYDTTLEVNSDFNLSAQSLTPLEGYENYTMWVINKTENGRTVPYKYVAVEKVDYTRNFLKFASEDTVLSIVNSMDDENLAQSLTRPSLTSTTGVTISVPLCNQNENNQSQNKILMKVYYNNSLVELNSNIYSIENGLQTLKLTNTPAGTYDLYFEDLAGNCQYFEGNAYLRIIILSEVAIKINGEVPVNYQIYNSSVSLTILEAKQYITNSSTYSISIEALKNNQSYTVKTNENGDYVFSDYGFYKVSITAYVNEKDKNAGNITKVGKTIYFTILNPNEALKEYSFVSLNGQNISKIIKDDVDVTNEIKRFLQVGLAETDVYNSSYLYDLTLTPELQFANYALNDDGTAKLNENGNKVVAYYDTYYASGHYEIFVETQNLILGTQTYSFKVWIREKDAYINLNTSIENGGTTSKEITISFNPYLMYSQIGECAIYVNDKKMSEINSESTNSPLTITIPRDAKGTYIVQLKQANGNTELSYIFNKTEPLSTVSIIIIVISSIAVAFTIILFVKLRTRMKIK